MQVCHFINRRYKILCLGDKCCIEVNEKVKFIKEDENYEKDNEKTYG